MDERLRKELLRSELKERNNGKKIIRCKYRPKYPDSAEREYRVNSIVKGLLHSRMRGYIYCGNTFTVILLVPFLTTILSSTR